VVIPDLLLWSKNGLDHTPIALMSGVSDFTLATPSIILKLLLLTSDRTPLESDSKNEGPTGGTTVTRDEAMNLADHWAAAWNAHNLDLIMGHYEDDVELTSPVAAQLLGTPDGKVSGKTSLRAYFQRGLEAYPELRFQLVDVLCGLNTVVLYYTNQKGTHTAEFMELSKTGKVARVVANYGA
jgi:hypothetical protein